MGTSSPELGDPSDTTPAPAPAPGCSGLLSVELLRLPPRLVLLTRCAAAAAARPGEKAENGDCQFMVWCLGWCLGRCLDWCLGWDNGR